LVSMQEDWPGIWKAVGVFTVHLCQPNHSYLPLANSSEHAERQCSVAAAAIIFLVGDVQLPSLNLRSSGWKIDKMRARWIWTWAVAGAVLFGASLSLVAGAQGQAEKAEPLKRMSTNADPSFDVVTIKVTDPGDQGRGFHLRGRRIFIENQTVNDLLIFAYRLHAKQLTGGPAWCATEHFDIEGVADVEGWPDAEQMQGMVRKLLGDRFQLKFHSETRELSVYAIAVAKGGPKLTRSTGGPNAMESENEMQDMGQMTMKARNMPISDLALNMDFFMDRPVVDRTGLTGKWDFQWKWTTDEARAASDPNAAPGLFRAIQEQLGLKLEPVKAPAEVLVIDDIERPSPN
jgi:uncharacterized protein (TIGR03435 family)